MARGDKSKYTDKQKRQAEHIEDSYEERGLSEDEAERRAWATVNKTYGGGNKPGGGGYGRPIKRGGAKKGGKKAAARKSAKKGGTKKAGSKKGSSKKGGAKKGGSKKGTSRKGGAKKGGR